MASETKFVRVWHGPPGRHVCPPPSKAPVAPGAQLASFSALPYLGELGDLLAHFDVHLGITVHSPASATTGIGFGARASPGRVNFAVEGRCHRYKTPSTQMLSLVLFLPTVCTCVRARACELAGFLGRGGTAVLPAAQLRSPCFPEMSASQARQRAHPS